MGFRHALIISRYCPTNQISPKIPPNKSMAEIEKFSLYIKDEFIHYL